MKSVSTNKSPMFITISAKCSDLCWARLRDKDGNGIGKDHDGYVPEWFGNDDSGDYVSLKIDVATGQIIGWKKPTKKQLETTFKCKL